MTIQEVTFTKAQLLAATYADANIPVFIWGAPGIGKSALVHDLASRTGALVVDIRLSMFVPVDLRGLPAIVEGKTVWLKPAFWPSVADQPVYLFFDEMDRAPASVKNAALQIVLDRQIGEHVLPDSVRIFAAGNGATDKGFAGSMGTALNNRFAHIEMVSDVDSWCTWADRTNLNPMLVAFMRMRGRDEGIFHELNPGRDQKAFPSARQWERVSKVLGAPAAIRHESIAGLVGDAIASEYIAFADMAGQLPDIADIIANPATAPVPASDKLSVLYAVAIALARVADQSNFAAIVEYAERMPAEFKILTVTSATRRDRELENTAACVRFKTNNQSVYATGV